MREYLIFGENFFCQICTYIFRWNRPVINVDLEQPTYNYIRHDDEVDSGEYVVEAR
jgi:hypothetical protein